MSGSDITRFGNSRDDVGRQLVFDEGNAIPQIELALFQPLDLKQVRPRRVLQGHNGGVQVAVLLLQARQLLPQVAFFLLGHCHRWFAGRPAISPPAPSSKLSRFGTPCSSHDKGSANANWYCCGAQQKNGCRLAPGLM